MFWKLFYQLKGVKGLNEAIKNGNIKDAVNFLKVYLDRPFDSSAEEPFLIFDFLDDFTSGRNSYEHYKLCESLMIGSKYFETMPLEKVVEALDNFAFVTTWTFDTEEFSTYLISKLTDSKILLGYSFRDIANLYECYSDFGFEDKILELGTDYIIKLSEELEASDSKELLAFCKDHLSLEELKKLCQKGDFSVKDIFDNVLHNYDSSELDTLFDIIINKVELENAVIETRRKRTISVFEQFLDELKEREKITEQHENYLAEKLLKSKKYPRMLDWLANIDCEANKKLIDELVGKVPDFTLLFAVSKKYIPYAVERVLQYGNIKQFDFQTGDTLFSCDYGDIEKLNLVLDTLYELKPDIKFSKDIVIKLLKNGVNKFPVLINEYELTEEERLEVLQTLRESKSEWLIIYGAYLVYGDDSTKYSEDTAVIKMARIRSLKSSSEEM